MEGREGEMVCAEGVAADLRLIKVNKPFSLLLSWRLKTKIHGCINYISYEERDRDEKERRWMAHNHPPLSAVIGRHISKLEARAVGHRVVHAVILNGESAVASVCFEICYGLPRDASSFTSNIVWLKRLSERSLILLTESMSIVSILSTPAEGRRSELNDKSNKWSTMPSSNSI